MSFTSNERTYDNLVVADFPVTTQRAVLISGQNVVRGEALGKITASGKLTTWGSGGSDDGHRTFYALAVEDCDASLADKAISFYMTGKFYKDNVTISGQASADDITDIEATARDIGIILVDNITAQV